MGKRGPKSRSLEQTKEAFWKKVRMGGPDECWVWLGACSKQSGRGIFRFQNRTMNVSRVALIFHLGRSLGRRMCSLHNCPEGDNPLCCNPAHLWEGTKSDNSKDMVKKGRGFPPVHLGEKHPNSKLTDVMVSQIRELYKEGWLQVAIAKKFRISQVRVSQLIRGWGFNGLFLLPIRKGMKTQNGKV